MNTVECFEEAEYHKVKEACKKYGYHTYLRFDEIHINTRFESWYFVPQENGDVKLMHGNTIGIDPDGWHTQFCRNHMSYDDLIKYLYEHEQGKYTNWNLPFTFTKRGVLRTALTVS